MRRAAPCLAIRTANTHAPARPPAAAARVLDVSLHLFMSVFLYVYIVYCVSVRVLLLLSVRVR